MEPFEQYRPKLFGIAYRMLGSMAEAEDAVQDTYLRWRQDQNSHTIANIEAYLVTVTTRLCIDLLKSARVQREQYVGPWLPEPIIASQEAGPEAQQELAETLSYAFMMLLEQLTPVERAVYILREAFDFKHGEIAEILGRSAADSRQLSHRARAHLGQQRKRYETSRHSQQQLFAQFLQAVSGDSLQPLFDLLAEDIAVHTDGGGKVRAALRVLYGKERVVQFIERVLQQQDPASKTTLCRVNGQPALRQTLGTRTISVITMQLVGNKVQQLFIVRNPDKLSNNRLPTPIL